MKIKNQNDFLTMYRLNILFSLKKCGLRTIRIFLKNKLVKSDISIVTFSIFPQMTRIWYYFWEPVFKSLEKNGIQAKCLIIDCSGYLSAKYFPKATVERFVNIYHARKLDYLIPNKLSSRLVWISDDDIFLTNPDLAVNEVKSFYIGSKLAAISFLPRTRWHFRINDEDICPMGSYCVILDKEIIISERLSFTNNIPNPFYPPNRYDTCDHMHIALLENGYKVKLLDKTLRNRFVLGFKGGSLWKILNQLCNKEELRDYFLNPFSYGTHIRDHLNSFYVSAQIAKIYNMLFNDDEFIPLFTEEELKGFVNKIKDDKCKTHIRNVFDSVDITYNKIVKNVRTFGKYKN